MIFLFTDFGSADLYVGQVKAALALAAPEVRVIDLLNDVPRFQIDAAAHLLAALAQRLPPASVTLAVVDPGVGTERRPIVLHCDQRWYVGPDNGLLSVLAARSASCQLWEIGWRPDMLSRSFHGRDLFAPIAARIATHSLARDDLREQAALHVQHDGGDAWHVIYVDSYGNALTGIRGTALDDTAVLRIQSETIRHAGIFAEAAEGEPFWYVNSIGLAEIACNRASAADRLGAKVGTRVARVAIAE